MDLLPVGPEALPTVVFWDDAFYDLDFAAPLTSWQIDTSQFVAGTVGYFGFGPDFMPNYVLLGSITSLQEVPEPSSILLLLSGTALCRLVQRTHSTKQQR